MLRDGSFGHPVYAASWSRGFDEFEVFVAQDELFLLRYKSGAIPSDGEAPGTVLIDRLLLNPQRDVLSLQPVYSATWRTADLDAFTSIEAFVLDGATHLLLVSAAWRGEIRILRVVPKAEGLDFVIASHGVRWSPGWDLVETLKVAGDWYVLSYKCGRASVDAEPAGQARIAPFTLDESRRVLIAPPVFDAPWGAGLTHAVSATRGRGAQLVTHNAATGTTELRLVAADVEQWMEALEVPVETQVWGFNPPWDVVEIVGHGKW